MEQKAGVRLRCENCNAEAIVVKPGDAELTCCGTPMVLVFAPPG